MLSTATFRIDPGNVVLVARQRALGAGAGHLDEMIADRQAEMMTEHRRAAVGDDGAAFFRELLQLRNGLVDGDAAEMAADIPRAGLPDSAAVRRRSRHRRRRFRECRRRGR